MGLVNNTLALVVTYNRLADLKVCIESLRHQSCSGFDILVVNNGSTDGTEDWLLKQNDLKVITQENRGGAGGFFTGMQYMMNNGYHYLVMMDDDGICDEKEIESLLLAYEAKKKEVKELFVLNSLVVDKENPELISFSWAIGVKRSSKVTDLKKEAFFFGIHPFNGTLLSRDVIERIGYIKKEMFIWGDEKEYMARAIHNNVKLITVTSAVHYHPKEKGIKGNVIPFWPKFKVLVKPEHLSHYYYRNEGYIYGTYPEKKKLKPLFWLAHVMYNLFRFRLKELRKFVVYFHKGVTGNFEN